MLIFLDMDGVLCDFVSSAMAVHGRKYNEDEWPRGEWDIAKVLGISVKQFWTNIGKQGPVFWEALKPYPWMRDLVLELRKVGEVVIATAPSRAASSYAGKRTWLVDHGLADIPCMLGSRKDLLAAPGRILIDDGVHNTTPWVENGGKSVLFPQPWNGRPRIADCHVVDYVMREVLCNA